MKIANRDSAAVVLKSLCNDLRGRSRGRDVRTIKGPEKNLRVDIPEDQARAIGVLGCHHDTRRDELADNTDSLRDIPSAIIAQIQDDAIDRAFARGLLKGFLNIFRARDAGPAPVERMERQDKNPSLGRVRTSDSSLPSKTV